MRISVNFVSFVSFLVGGCIHESEGLDRNLVSLLYASSFIFDVYTLR